ncbi:MAG: TetR/AcrR family transcriptional regulator [Syntrophales bacterium]|nr:TetR/AcrR family transcriptional regulator [Syntrophales bacterium]
MDINERILNAATRVFARSGYGGARMAEIASEAGVNKATIYYHIGGKDDLYREVLHRVIKKVAHNLDYVFSTPMKPLEKLQAYIETINRIMAENPYVPPIVIREIVTGGAHIPQMVIDELLKVIGRLGEIITEGVERGELHPVHPFLFHIMTAGSCALSRLAGALSSRMPQIKDFLPEEKLGDNLKELLTRAISRR